MIDSVEVLLQTQYPHVTAFKHQNKTRCKTLYTLANGSAKI